MQLHIENRMKAHSAQTIVLSLPAGTSYSALVASQVYSCPVSYPEFSDTFVAFRQQGGGKMDVIYSVDALITLTPPDTSNLERINPAYLERLITYIRDREDYFASTHEAHRFYLLSPQEQLPHGPHPLRNNAYRCRYTWRMLTSGEEIVTPDA